MVYIPQTASVGLRTVHMIFGRPLQVTVRRIYGTVVRSVLGLSVCMLTLVYCGQTLGGSRLTSHDATWYGGRPRPRRHCVRWGPSSPPHGKEHSAPPNGRPSISATAELLLLVYGNPRCCM